MDRNVRRTAIAWMQEERPAVVVVVLEVRGSAPRASGARMLVSRGQSVGSIGGGPLEREAIREAQAMLSGGVAPHQVHYPAGPACDGAITLGYTRLDAAQLSAWPEPEPLLRLQMYGASHVATAIARLLATLDCSVDWIDAREELFPFSLVDGAAWPGHIRVVPVDDVVGEVRAAPPGACHLVVMHEHEIDLRLCEAILRRGDFAWLGMLGSAGKRERFMQRFDDWGVPPERSARVVCPIGVPGIEGKEPEVIAVATVAQLLQVASSAAAS
jgi:xanthine dehydrogenase accessory factor